VISPILFCIFIDDLLTRLSSSGVGCYVGLDFAGALFYADDIVILAPTPTAMRQLLAICDSYASEFDIIFNADKSKFLVLTLFFCKLFDNVVLDKFHANLRTSDLQFGFKSRHSTTMCTMVLK